MKRILLQKLYRLANRFDRQPHLKPVIADFGYDLNELTMQFERTAPRYELFNVAKDGDSFSEYYKGEGSKKSNEQHFAELKIMSDAIELCENSKKQGFPVTKIKSIKHSDYVPVKLGDPLPSSFIAVTHPFAQKSDVYCRKSIALYSNELLNSKDGTYTKMILNVPMKNTSDTFSLEALNYSELRIGAPLHKHENYIAVGLSATPLVPGEIRLGNSNIYVSAGVLSLDLKKIRESDSLFTVIIGTSSSPVDHISFLASVGSLALFHLPPNPLDIIKKRNPTISNTAQSLQEYRQLCKKLPSPFHHWAGFPSVMC